MSLSMSFSLIYLYSGTQVMLFSLHVPLPTHNLSFPIFAPFAFYQPALLQARGRCSLCFFPLESDTILRFYLSLSVLALS